MTLYAQNTETPAPLPFRIRLSDGRLRTDPSTFTDAEIADAGYQEAPDKPNAQPWERVSWDADAWQWVVSDRPLADVQAERVRDIESQHNAILDGGFDYDFGAKSATLEDGTVETAGVRTLQTRPADRERWATTNQVASQYIGAGQPGEPMRPFRAADNARVPMTAQEANACLNAMQAKFGAALEAMWDHKDAVRTTATAQTAYEYDDTTLWP